MESLQNEKDPLGEEAEGPKEEKHNLAEIQAYAFVATRMLPYRTTNWATSQSTKHYNKIERCNRVIFRGEISPIGYFLGFFKN